MKRSELSLIYILMTITINSCSPKCNEYLIILKEFACGSSFHTLKPIEMQKLNSRQRESIKEEMECYDGCILEFQYLSNTKITTECHKDVPIANNTIHTFIPDEPRATPRRVRYQYEPPDLNTTTELYVTTSTQTPTTEEKLESTIGNTVVLKNITNNIDNAVTEPLPLQTASLLPNISDIVKIEEIIVTTSSPVTEQNTMSIPITSGPKIENAIDKAAIKYLSKDDDIININITYTEPVLNTLNNTKILLALLLACKHDSEHRDVSENILATITNYTSRTDFNVSTQFGDITINGVTKQIRLQNCNFDYVTYTLFSCNTIEFVTIVTELIDSKFEDTNFTLLSLNDLHGPKNVYLNIYGTFEDGKKQLNLSCTQLLNSDEETKPQMYDIDDLTKGKNVVIKNANRINVDSTTAIVFTSASTETSETESDYITNSIDSIATNIEYEVESSKANEDLTENEYPVYKIVKDNNSTTTYQDKQNKTETYVLNETISGNAPPQSDHMTYGYDHRGLHEVEISLMAIFIAVTSAILTYYALHKWKQRHQRTYNARDAVNRL